MNVLRCATVAVIGCLLSASAAAIQPSAAQLAEGRKQYADMCIKAANMPKPYGEWDLKGNAKLPAYCDCFAAAFLDRAIRSMPDFEKGKHPTVEQSNKEELALRNVCRKKTGLPVAVDPNVK